MKTQIKCLNPHQNGKVFAVLMAFSSLIIFVPMAILMSFFAPNVDQHGNSVAFPIVMFIVMPFFYLIFGYIFVAIGCKIYNFFYQFVGGIEFELENQNE